MKPSWWVAVCLALATFPASAQQVARIVVPFAAGGVQQGVVPLAMSPEAFGKLLQSDFGRMERIVKAAGARID